MCRALIIATLAFAACNAPRGDGRFSDAVVTDTLMRLDSGAAFRDSNRVDGTVHSDTTLPAREASGNIIDTRNVNPMEVVTFAQTLIGTRYKYGSTDPAVGFDCSGFITYVFNHFDVTVPRSSRDFTNIGSDVDTMQARTGDIILFTGTNPQERFVGHMGIVVARDATGLRFIHSSSGKANGVTITPLNEYYKGRFVRVARIFP
ncbi:MAG: NlpC/P60 family protein [Chitinophagaceae bacterium]|nr:MAG: NlpC/P60 family protein [Chitinophagaceae bacterium]